MDSWKFGPKIKQLRKKKKLTQKELAKKGSYDKTDTFCS